MKKNKITKDNAVALANLIIAEIQSYIAKHQKEFSEFEATLNKSTTEGEKNTIITRSQEKTT